MFTPFMHSANIIPITDKDKSKLHPERSALPQAFNSRDSRKPPDTPFSIFMRLNLDLRFTTVDQLLVNNNEKKNSDCRSNAFPMLKIQQRINKKNKNP